AREGAARRAVPQAAWVNWPAPAAGGGQPVRCAGASGDAAWGAEGQAQCDLLRDLFGNPFRAAHAVEPSWPAAGGGAARTLARHISEGPHLEELPALADSLQGAGCADAGLLGHLRGPGPHVRGCWALDLVLGKA